jgi:hypothetical protein
MMMMMMLLYRWELGVWLVGTYDILTIQSVCNVLGFFDVPNVWWKKIPW